MIIGWLNEKGGVGKTTLCFNVGWYLASLSKKVLFIDLDGQKANLTFFCGVKDRDNLLTLKDVLSGNIELKKAIIKVNDNIDIIPGNVELVEIDKSITISKAKEIIRPLERQYDYIFIDVSPAPTRLHILTTGIANYIIIPMLSDVAALEANTGIVETYSIVKDKGINGNLEILGFIFNKYSNRTSLAKEVAEITKKMAKQLNTSIFNTKIRNNIALSENVSQHIGITDYKPKCNGAYDIISLTSEILTRVR